MENSMPMSVPPKQMHEMIFTAVRLRQYTHTIPTVKIMASSRTVNSPIDTGMLTI